MCMSLKTSRVANGTRLLLVSLMLIPLLACNQTEKPSVRTFASTDEAGTALLEAAKSGDQNALLAIFGPQAKDLLYSGDVVEDKAAVDAFVAAYPIMHRWRKIDGGNQILLVGAENFPFPIPLKQNASGQWFFDTAAGRDEILARRIGRNELAVMDVCGALVDAQAEYFSQPRDGQAHQQYALKFISDTGKQNGLYWESSAEQPKSPLGPLVAFATAEGYSTKPNSHVPFHGYYFHMLNGQGSHAPGGAKDYLINGKMTAGFAYVAYPAEYGNSGIMTFIINQDGLLFQKDLGKTTTAIATALTQFDPDSSWSPVEP
jgi:Protein of unknown function (DUF2950)